MRFWLHPAGYLTGRLAFYCPSFWLYEWLVKDWQAAFCVACDSDKRLRRVRVSRMLPGKEEREEGAFFHFMLPVDVTLSPSGFSRTWRRSAAGGFYGALASCWMARWTMTVEPNSFVWMLLCECLVFKRADSKRIFIFVKWELTLVKLNTARGGSIQARPGRQTMRITSWLFCLCVIQTV